MSSAKQLPALTLARPPTSSTSQTELSPRAKKNGLLSRHLSQLVLLTKKRESSETTLLVEFADENYVPQSTSIRRPLADDRENSRRELRELFMHEAGQIICTRLSANRWLWMRSCMELFPLSAYFSFEFLTITTKFTQSSHFSGKLETFLRQVVHWCSLDLLNSLKSALEMLDIIRSVIEYATEPVKFTINGHCWKEVISEALTYDLREFNKVFLDSVVIYELHNAEDDILQNVVDVFQLAIKRGEARDSRELDRFLRVTLEKRGILPSTIFLTGVRRTGANFVHGGGFADVWRGQYEGRLVALKVLRIFNSVDRKKMQLEFSKEALLWRKLDHPNVLPFLGICRDEFAPQIALVSHWMEKGNLIDFIDQNPLADCLKLASGVACGLEYLHSLKPQIIHGDLRAANVLVGENDEPRITDFGLARAIDSQGTSIATSFKGRGTLRWQAPELLHASRFGEDTSKLTTKSDVYAFSCVCLEIFTGNVPFIGLRDGQVIMEVAVHDRKPPWPGQDAALQGLSDDVWSIMQLCWETQPSSRPDMPFVVSQLQCIDFQRNTF